MTTATADFGLIGLAVMGENLVLNVESRNFTCAGFNRTTAKVDAFVNGRGAGKKFVGCHSIEDLCKSLKKPRKVHGDHRIWLHPAGTEIRSTSFRSGAELPDSLPTAYAAGCASS